MAVKQKNKKAKKQESKKTRKQKNKLPKRKDKKKSEGLVKAAKKIDKEKIVKKAAKEEIKRSVLKLPEKENKRDKGEKGKEPASAAGKEGEKTIKSQVVDSRRKTEYGLVAPQAIVEEMSASYLDYAMSVIVSRALPDVRDGLKPVHRRILYAMWSIGLKAGAKFRKSATVVGEVLGKYHPHGDTAWGVRAQA